MRERGFTLLEMIVVLAILGLATALVAPSMLRGIDSWRRQAAMDVLIDAIRALPGDARARGRRDQTVWVHRPVENRWVVEREGLRVVTATLERSDVRLARDLADALGAAGEGGAGLSLSPRTLESVYLAITRTGETA